MKTKRVIRFSAVVAILVTVGILGWLVWANDIAAGYFNPGSPEAQGVIPVLLETSPDGSIRYGYGIELPTRFAGAMVEYDYQTMEGINQYSAFNQSHLDRLLEAASGEDVLAVRVTFNQPLSQASFTAFVEQYRMSVKSYVIWTENSDGTTTTIQGAPSETELIPAERFDYVWKDVQSRGGQGFPGWVEVDGNVPASDLKALSHDSRVFLADVMEAVIKEQFTDATMKQAGIPQEVRAAVLSEGLQVSRPVYLAWAIRNLGLMNETINTE